MVISPEHSIHHKIVRTVRSWLIQSGIDASHIAGAEEFSALICDAMKRGTLLLNGFEAAGVMHFVRSTTELDGSIAELGTYAGGSAHLICEFKGDTPLHLFDTFDGLPELTSADSNSAFAKGMFVSSEHSVREYLSAFAGVFVHPGYFPGTALPVANERFRFVHLDADLYEATKAGLEFLYPRMVQQGVILIHDCRTSGVAQAYTEFMVNKPEIIHFQPAGNHCFLVKA